jgi:hypothetical protein
MTLVRWPPRADREVTDGRTGRLRQGRLISRRYVDRVELEQILGVLHGWVGIEIEVSAHGGRGMAPVSAVSVRGRLRTGDVLSRPDKPEVFLFVLVDPGGRQVGSFALDTEVFRGGGWLDGNEEVLDVESGVVQLLIATAVGDEDGDRRD